MIVDSIKTERLVLRPFVDGDAEDVLALMSDDYISRMAAFFAHLSGRSSFGFGGGIAWDRQQHILYPLSEAMPYDLHVSTRE